MPDKSALIINERPAPALHIWEDTKKRAKESMDAGELCAMD